MNKIKYILIFIGLFYAPQTFACKNNKARYDLNFEYLKNGEVEVQITRDQNKTSYLLDDTGYLGCELAVTQFLLKNGVNDALDFRSNQKTIIFFKDRLRKLRQTLLPYDSDQKFSRALKELEELSVSDMPLKELHAKWLAFNELLRKRNIHVQSKEKKSSDSPWSSKERDLKEFDLPSPFRSRSLVACNSEISEFNVGSGAEKTSDSLKKPIKGFEAKGVQ